MQKCFVYKMELNKYTKQCKYVIAVLQINSHGSWLPVLFHLYFNSTITEVLKKHWRSGVDMQGTATTEMMLIVCTVPRGNLQWPSSAHFKWLCSSTRIHLLPDFSTLVYSADGSAQQPPFQWLRAHTLSTDDCTHISCTPAITSASACHTPTRNCE